MLKFKVGDKVLFPVWIADKVEWNTGHIHHYRSDIDKFDVCGTRHWGWYKAHELKPVPEESVENVLQGT